MNEFLRKPNLVFFGTVAMWASPGIWGQMLVGKWVIYFMLGTCAVLHTPAWDEDLPRGLWGVSEKKNKTKKNISSLSLSKAFIQLGSIKINLLCELKTKGRMDSNYLH